MPQKEKFKKLNFYIEFSWIYYTSPFIWYICIHHVKYLDKPIKCLEMRAKIKSVRKFSFVFSVVFSLICENRTFFTYLNFDEKYLLVYFKSQITNNRNKVKKYHMFQVIKIFKARGISKYFLTGLTEHTEVIVVLIYKKLER